MVLVTEVPPISLRLIRPSFLFYGDGFIITILTSEWHLKKFYLFDKNVRMLKEIGVQLPNFF